MPVYEELFGRKDFSMLKYATIEVECLNGYNCKNIRLNTTLLISQFRNRHNFEYCIRELKM